MRNSTPFPSPQLSHTNNLHLVSLPPPVTLLGLCLCCGGVRLSPANDSLPLPTAPLGLVRETRTGLLAWFRTLTPRAPSWGILGPAGVWLPLWQLAQGCIKAIRGSFRLVGARRRVWLPLWQLAQGCIKAIRGSFRLVGARRRVRLPLWQLAQGCIKAIRRSFRLVGTRRRVRLPLWQLAQGCIKAIRGSFRLVGASLPPSTTLGDGLAVWQLVWGCPKAVQGTVPTSVIALSRRALREALSPRSTVSLQSSR